jgi:desulfoferrodoxin (superoxide reductase-like protein)
MLLTAVLTHDLSGSMVKDTAKHFVKTITVTVNGNAAISQNILSQESPAGETVQYKLRLKKGDKVNVVGACNIFGSIGKDFIVP